jgi:glycine/D-amino acid oxidase-like deaminating enzyme
MMDLSRVVDAVVIGGGMHGARIADHLPKLEMRVLLGKKVFAAGGTGNSTAKVR